MKSVRFKYYLDAYTEKPEPMFGLIVGTERTDVCGETVLKAGVPLPLFPDYKTWRTHVIAKTRCGRCWRVVRGHNDLVRHTETNHPRAPIHMPAKEHYL